MVVARQTVVALLMVSSTVWLEAVASDSNFTSTESSTTTVSTTTGTSTEATTTGTSSVTHTRGFACLGDRVTFDATYGPCATYHRLVEYNDYYNHVYCEVDFDNVTSLSAAQVCPECLFCSTECLGDASIYDAGYGNCSSYAEELDNNWEYCVDDYDNVTGLWAFEACVECQRCLPPTTETNTSTSTGTGTEAASTASPSTVTDAPAAASTQAASTMAPMTASVTLTQAPLDEASAARQGSGIDAWPLLFLSATLARP